MLLLQGDMRNLLLRFLDADAFASLSPHLDRVPVREGEVVGKAGEPISSAYFPEHAVIGFIDPLEDGNQVGFAVTGYEGMTGWPIFLETERSPGDSIVTVGGGTAIRAPAAALIETCSRHPESRALFLRYVQTLIVQVARTAASNLRDPVETRMARWLLMNHDRLVGDEIDLTHKHIAAMLGVRRASITDALHLLEGRGAIKASRGHIVIRDRAALKAIAGYAYGRPEAHYRQLIGPFGKCAVEPEPAS